MNDINYLLLQVLIVIFPIFIYQTFLGDKFHIHDTKQGNIYQFILLFLSLSFCMLLPTFLTAEFRFDLRLIPITIGFLYGGYAAGFLLTFTSIVYRISLSGILGFYHYGLVLIFYIPIVCLIMKWYRNADQKKRIRSFVLLSLYPYLCSLLALFLLGNMKLVKVAFSIDLLGYLSVMYITSWFAVFLIEKMRENIQMKLELQQTEKMKMLRDLSSVLAHEIRNPMQVTRGFLQLIDTPDLPQEKRNYIQISIEELDRANEIIGDFLSLSKPPAKINQRVDVGNQLMRVIHIMQNFASEQNVSLKTHMTGDLWVIANPQKFNQCMINILKNAIESMPNGGIVSVGCYKRENKFAVIDIEDQGIGLSTEQIQRLGSPFYSLKEKGTGIGLMISYQIIQSFHGKVKVTSQKGNGTKFSISLPIING